MSSLWLLGLALAVLLSAGMAEGQTGWTKYVDNPVLEAGDPGAWDQGGVMSGTVLFDGAMYHMWYGGFRTIPLVWPDLDIGYATSPDGVTWTKHPLNPVFVRAGTWDSAGIWPGAVVWDGALYHMWYVGGTSASPTQTGYATSPDGVSWTRLDDPVLTGDPGGWDAAQADIHAVIADGGTYRAWYNGCAAAGSWSRIGYATSPDGVVWDKHPDPVLWPLGYGWDGYFVNNPEVVFDGTYHMWYTGYGGSVVQIGHAASVDGVNWVRQPAYPPVLTLGPAGAWDSGGVDLPQVVLAGDTAHMWYTGWKGALQSVAIGHATAPLPSPDARECFIPAAAVAAGAHGAFFQTDVEVNNTGAEEAEVVFQWLPRGEDNSEPLESDPITLTAGQSLRYENVLTEIFGLGPGSVGAIKLVASTEDVIGMSRTYNIPAGETAGTFGQGLPAIRATEMIPPGVKKRIIFMSESDDVRANLGCVSGVGTEVAVTIELYDSEGVNLDTKYMMLPPYSNRQINGILQDYAPLNGYVDVRTYTPGAWIYCYGSVLDNTTSDPTTVPPM